MSRRTSGEGTICKHPGGLWQGKVSLGYSVSGKRVRRSVYGKTQEEVRKKMDTLRRKYRPGVTSFGQTVDAYLTGWMRDEVTVNTAPKTALTYQNAVDLHIRPYLGSKKLEKLTSEELRQWQRLLKELGKSDSVRHRAMSVLCTALNAAVRMEIIPENPLSRLKKPKIERRTPVVLEKVQSEKLIEVCSAHRIGDIVIVALFTGMRMGELIGLHWTDIDFEKRLLHVQRAVSSVRGKSVVKVPKTKNSRRTIVLDPIAMRALQERQRKANADGTNSPIVFCNFRRGYLSQSNLYSHVWKPLRKAAGLPDTFRFHDLRHTHASMLYSVGAGIRHIQERLGHADVGLTMALYTHLFQDAQRESVDRLASLGISYDVERKTQDVGTEPNANGNADLGNRGDQSPIDDGR